MKTIFAFRSKCKCDLATTFSNRQHRSARARERSSRVSWMGEIALDRLIQRAGLDPVKCGEIEIQDHLFMANPVDFRSDGRRGKGKGVLWHGRSASGFRKAVTWPDDFGEVAGKAAKSGTV